MAKAQCLHCNQNITLPKDFETEILYALVNALGSEVITFICDECMAQMRPYFPPMADDDFIETIH